MERFVRAVVAGGLLLLAGLWLAEASAAGSPPWLGGAALAALGAGGLAFGVYSELSVP
ncbi:MAG: hypothetical protein ABEH40_03245 [Haloferacaceae archaeon]